MKKRGFTLIELIGVIVLLAIVAIIAVPVTLGIVNNTKKQAFLRTLDNSINAFEIAIADYEIKGDSINKIDITSDDLNLDNNKFISGEIRINEKGEYELFYVSDGSFCAYGTKGNYKVEKGNCSYLDETEPVINSVSLIATNDSIQVIVNAKDLESGIKKIEYSLDNKNWTTTGSNFIISNLDKGIEYTIYIKVTNNNGAVTTKTIKKSTANIELPTIKIEPNEWSLNKTVVITFPNGDYQCQYSLNGEEWITSEDKKVVLELDEKSFINIRITAPDGSYILLTQNIDKIDKEAPTCTIEVENADIWSSSKKIIVRGKDDGSIYGIILPRTDKYILNDKAVSTIASNGEYVAIVKDKIGNTNTCSVNVTKIDNTAPQNVTTTVLNKTDKTITILAYAFDKESGIANYEFKLDDGEYQSNNTDKFTFNAIGDHTITVKVTNNAGLNNTFEFKTNEVSNKPTYKVSPEGWSNVKTVTITYPGNNNYVYQYSVNGSEWITTQDNIVSIDFTKNGYVIARMLDGDKVYIVGIFNVEFIDITAPTSIDVKVTDKTESTVTVEATAKDSETNIVKYEFKIDNGYYVTTTKNTFVYEGVTSGIHTIKVRATNEVGLSIESKDIKVIPKINTKISYVLDPEAWSIDKNVKITFPKGLINYYKIDDGEWILAKNIVTVIPLTKPSVISTKVTDGENELSADIIEVKTIDTRIPSCTITSSEDATWTTTKTLTVTGIDEDSKVYGIILPGEEDYTLKESATKSVDKNGTYEATVKDNAGRTNKCSIKVTKIDNTAPTNVKASLQATTSDTITIEANAVDTESGITKYEFSLDGANYIDNGTNKVYKFSAVSLEKHKLKIRATNGVGLTTESPEYEVAPGEKVLPTFEISTSNWAQSKTVTITYPERKANYTYQYQKNGGEWITLETGVMENITFTSNGYLIGRISDGVNTYTSASYNVTKIDTTAPTGVLLSVTDTSTNSITVTASGNDVQSGISKYEFSIDSSNFVDNGNGKVYKFTNVGAGNHNIKVRLTNAVGLQTESTPIVASPTSMSAPTITIAPTTWSITKTVTITYLEGNYLYYYKINGSEWVQTLEKVKTLEFDANGTIQARISDSINVVDGEIINVNNFDTHVPTCTIEVLNPTTISNQKTLTITGNDEDSGVESLKAPNAEGFTLGETLNFIAPTNGEYTATVKDKAGRTNTCSVVVSNIDITGPTGVSAVLRSKTTNTLTIEATGIDNESGISKYEFSIDGGTFIDNENNNAYTFEEVTTGNHDVLVRVTNGVSLTTTSSVLQVSPNPVTLAQTEITPSGWAQGKYVVINFPEGFENSYNKNNNGWVNVTESQISVPFTSNGYIVIRVSDGVNIAETSTINITMIDEDAPSCSIIVENLNDWTTSKQLTISSSDETSGIYGLIIPNDTNYTEGETATYVANANGDYVVTVKDNAGRTNTCSTNISTIDTTEPTNVIAALQSRTTNTLTIEATGIDNESGITKYEFKIDDEEYIDNLLINTYQFINVDEETHNIQIRVTNGSGLTTESSILQVTTVGLTGPLFNINNDDWAQSKTITITYPPREAGFVYSYSKDSEEWIILETGVIANVLFNDNGTIQAKVFDGVNTRETDLFSVIKIDNTAPINVVATLDSKTTNSLTVIAGGTDNESGITKYEFKIDDNEFVDNLLNNTYTFNEVTTGEHSIIVRVTNGSGLTTESLPIIEIPNNITLPTYEIDTDDWAQTKTVTITYPEGDYIYQYKKDDGEWQTTELTSFDVTFDDVGYVIARVTDNTNFFTASTQNVTKIDTEAPTCTIEVSDFNDWKTSKTLTITGNDDESLVYGIMRPEESTYIEGTSTTKEVTANGEYVASVKDNVGRTNTCSIVVTKIDTTEPTNVTLNQTGNTTNSISVNANAVDIDSSIIKYEFKIDDEEFVDNSLTQTYMFTGVTSGSHNAYVRVTNGSGLTTTSDALVVSTGEIDYPTYEINNNGWAQTKTVTITYPNEPYQYQYKKDDGEWQTTLLQTQEVEFMTNGFVTARIYDGTNYFTSEQYNVLNIDSEIPTCTIEANDDDWATSKQLTITGFDDESLVYGIMKPGESTYIEGETATILAISNGEYVANVKDNVGRTNTCSITISKIDTTAPTNVTVVTKSRTTNTITVMATAFEGESLISKYEFKIDDNEYIDNNNQNIYTFEGITTGNHTVFTRVTNASGLATTSSGLTTSPNTATLPTYMIDTDDWAQTKTVTITYPERQPGFIYEYNQNNTGWQTVTGLTQEVSFTTNGYVIARIYDETNYFTAATQNITKVDINIPTCNIEVTDLNDWTTSKTLTITGTDENDSGVYGILKPGDTTYSEGISTSLEVISNGEYVATIKDNVGRTNTCSVTISKIDTTAPTNITVETTSKTTNTITVNVTAIENESVITKYEFKIDDNEYVDNGNSNIYTYENVTTGNHDAYVKVTNASGLETESSLFTLSPGPITLPTYEVDSTDWAQTKTVTITYPEGSYFYSYKKNDEEWTSTTNRVQGIEFTTEGNVTARVFDGTNYFLADIYSVTLIDENVPTCSIEIASANDWKTSKILTIEGLDAESLIYGIMKPGDTSYTEGTSVTYEATSNGEYVATVRDNAGRTNTCSTTVSKIDTTAPTNVTVITESRTTNTITVVATATENQSSIAKYEFKIDDNEYVDNNNSNTYTFEAVTTGEHIVLVRVTNIVDLSTISAELNTSPNTATLPTYMIDTDDWAQSKTVTITYPERQTGFTYEYSKNGESWITVTGVVENVTFTDNGYVIARIYDNTNYFTAATQNITKIDTINPTCNIVVTDENDWKPSKTLTITGLDAESLVYGIIKPGDISYTEGASVTYEAISNGEYTATVKDNAGRTNTCSVTISKIDTTAPTDVALYTVTSSTNAIAVRIEGEDAESGLLAYEFSIDGGEYQRGDNPLFTHYQFEQVTTGEHTIIGRAINNAGLITESNPIEMPTVSPEIPTYELSSTDWEQTKTVTITYQSYIGGLTNQYSKDGGEWITVTGSTVNVPFDNNGYVIARITDNTNYFTASTQNITKVDTQLPTCNMLVSNENDWKPSKSITINSSDEDSGVYGIMKPGDTSYTEGASATLDVTSNGTYTATVKDNVGRTNTCSVTVSKIDTTAPTNVTINVQSSNLTSATVKSTATENESGILYYKYAIDDGTWTQNGTNTGATDTNTITLSPGTHTLYVQVTNGSGLTTTANTSVTIPLLRGIDFADNLNNQKIYMEDLSLSLSAEPYFNVFVTLLETENYMVRLIESYDTEGLVGEGSSTVNYQELTLQAHSAGTTVVLKRIERDCVFGENSSCGSARVINNMTEYTMPSDTGAAIYSATDDIKVNDYSVSKKTYNASSLSVNDQLNNVPLKLTIPDSFTMTAAQCETEFMQWEGDGADMSFWTMQNADYREYGGPYAFMITAGFFEDSITIFQRDLETNTLVTNLQGYMYKYGDMRITSIDTSSPIYQYVKKVTFN